LADGFVADKIVCCVFPHRGAVQGE